MSIDERATAERAAGRGGEGATVTERRAPHGFVELTQDTMRQAELFPISQILRVSEYGPGGSYVRLAHGGHFIAREPYETVLRLMREALERKEEM